MSVAFFKVVTAGVAGLLAMPLAWGANDAPAADRIFAGGPILTMNDHQPRAEAVAIQDGRIVAVGSRDDVMAYHGEGTTLIDLEGRALLPGFVDAHGHAFMIGLQAISANLLAPPDGGVTRIAELQDALRGWEQDDPGREQRIGLILGFGYDDAQLAEQRHPTRADLDAVSTEVPVLIIHQSGHMGVVNGRALEFLGISADTPNPEGGVIRRQPDSQEPNGVLEEAAFFGALAQQFSQLNEDDATALFKAGTGLLAQYGYTTGQEGRSTPGLVPLMQKAASAGDIDIDVVTYVDAMVDRSFIEQHASREYVNGFRVGGAKLTIDGSPQGFTAFRDRPYYNPPEGYRADYAGYTAVTPDQTFEVVDWAFANDVQILTHANGEGASDILLAAIKTAREKHGTDADRRAVLIHGQFLREDQVDAMQRLDVIPSLFPMHTFYWGDWHRDRTVGPARADFISPTGWVHERGMKFSTHHDAPVAFPDSMRVLSATVTRRTRSGDILGPSQRVDAATALKAMTLWPAWQHFEEDRKGSIEVGKLADFVVLSDDPLAVDPETLDQLQVVETIKKGETIFRRDDDDGAQARSQAAVGDAVSRLFNRVQHSRYAAQLGPHTHGPEWLMSALAAGR